MKLSHKWQQTAGLRNLALHSLLCHMLALEGKVEVCYHFSSLTIDRHTTHCNLLTPDCLELCHQTLGLGALIHLQERKRCEYYRGNIVASKHQTIAIAECWEAFRRKHMRS